MRNFSTMLSLLSRRTIALAMILVNEQLLGYRWEGFRRLTVLLYTLAYFSWIGAFSPSPLAAFSHEVQDALEDPIKINKINKSLCLFAIVAGDKDLLAGSEAEYFDSRLRGLKIQHVYTVIPGTHSMFVWRPALSNFLQEIFKQ